MTRGYPEQTFQVTPAIEVARFFVKQIKEAEKLDAQYGLIIPGDSALAVVFNSMEEYAYAGDPRYDSRVAK